MTESAAAAGAKARFQGVNPHFVIPDVLLRLSIIATYSDSRFMVCFSSRRYLRLLGGTMW